jgi:hypothetical protein
MSDLFNNPAVNNALKSMTPEQLDEYKRFGESLYGSINFEDSTLVNSMPPPMAESVAYVEEGIKSGLLPEDLTEDEVTLLSGAYGKEWYLKYGFKEHEVPEIGLSLHVKQEIDNAVQQKIDEAVDKRNKQQEKRDAKKEKKTWKRK